MPFSRNQVAISLNEGGFSYRVRAIGEDNVPENTVTSHALRFNFTDESQTKNVMDALARGQTCLMTLAADAQNPIPGIAIATPACHDNGSPIFLAQRTSYDIIEPETQPILYFPKTTDNVGNDVCLLFSNGHRIYGQFVERSNSNPDYSEYTDHQFYVDTDAYNELCSHKGLYVTPNFIDGKLAGVNFIKEGTQFKSQDAKAAQQQYENMLQATWIAGGFPVDPPEYFTQKRQVELLHPAAAGNVVLYTGKHSRASSAGSDREAEHQKLRLATPSPEEESLFMQLFGQQYRLPQAGFTSPDHESPRGSDEAFVDFALAPKGPKVPLREGSSASR